ncbi:hypothetical protein [Amycolatopsis alkalitolerans]|uniref:Uncharacterized protein n=1 Tax=Amycolatopsis alkalitolerans TaxID=2547244 RepID=A0A5C4M664_9PSEU|nr:hypothetical protein [Amycolatopsis alkalitolerans]TNC26131.1 hypothetical protein FG385_13285 [Amycolatopsis alkalitolerans]
MEDTNRSRQTLGRAKFFVAAYGLLSVVVLGIVATLAVTGHPVTAFMWGRSGGVLASAAVAYWLTLLAARGRRWAYVRVRIISIVVPVAIVAIDSIPGALPPWFVALQVVCALAMAGAAFSLPRKGSQAYTSS